jgi:hypothetical protein
MDQSRPKRQRTGAAATASAGVATVAEDTQQPTTAAAATKPPPRRAAATAATAAAAADAPRAPTPENDDDQTTTTTTTTIGPGVQASLAEFRAAAVPFLVGRLVDARSEHAHTLALRPSLQRLSREIARVLGESASLGHNASLLVVGDAGGGKTLAVERAVAAVCARHNAGLPSDNPAVGVVRLSGALHGDERGAMAEIARQLCDAFGVARAAAAASAAAAAAASTAANPNPSSTTADAAAHVFSRAASFGDNLAFLAELLSRLHGAMKAVVFILDEAEAYVRAPQRQVVLYNLLDALQRSGVRAAVIGVTTHWDLVEGMEKRVRSRFESRTLVVAPLAAPAQAEAAQAEAAELEAKRREEQREQEGATTTTGRGGRAGGSRGTTNSNDNENNDDPLAAALAAASEARDETPAALLRAMLSLPHQFEPRHHAATHNTAVKRALEAEPVRRALAEAADAGATPRDVGGLAVAALVRAAGRSAASSGGAAMVNASDVMAAVRAAREAQDGRATAVTALSVLECALLAAAARVEERAAAAAQALAPGAGTAAAGVGATGGGAGAAPSSAAALAALLPVVNFEAVYEEFSRVTLRGSEFDHLRSKPAAWRAFRDLVAAGLAEFLGGAAGAGGGGGAAAGGGGGPHALTLPYAPVQLLLHRKDLEQGLERHPLCPAWLKNYLQG